MTALFNSYIHKEFYYNHKADELHLHICKELCNDDEISHDVEIDHPVPAVVVPVFQTLEAISSSIVDNQIRNPHLLLNPGGHPDDVLPVGQVALHHQAPAPLPLYL